MNIANHSQPYFVIFPTSLSGIFSAIGSGWNLFNPGIRQVLEWIKYDFHAVHFRLI